MPVAAPSTGAGTTRTLYADGLAVHTVEWRTPRSHPERRVLLLHGLGANTLSWEPFAGPLADRLDAVVTAVDLAGFGRTRAPAGRAQLGRQRQLVRRLLDRLGPSLVVGNSMGGSIGIGVTADRPEHVRGLVLVNPAVPHPRPGMGDWLRMAWLAPLAVPALGAGVVALRARALGPERLVDFSLAASLRRAESLPDDLRRRMIELTAERLRWVEAAPAYAAAARSLIAYLAFGLHRDLGVAAAERPTLLLHGAEDELVPLAAAEHAAAAHDLDFEVLDDLGHAPQLENPGRVIDAVASWVDAHGPPGWPDPAPR